MVHFPNFQDMFIMLKASLDVYHAQSFLGYFTGYLYKIKMAAMGVSLIIDRLFMKYKKCEYLENRKR